jgi:hypothetical protein
MKVPSILEDLIALPPGLLTIAQVAGLLKRHPQTVYRMVRQKVRPLPVIRIDSAVLVDRSQLAGWLRDKGARRLSRIRLLLLFLQQPVHGDP